MAHNNTPESFVDVPLYGYDLHEQDEPVEESKKDTGMHESVVEYVDSMSDEDSRHDGVFEMDDEAELSCMRNCVS
jgi:hypothetical protein